jgi:hypothetical protein
MALSQAYSASSFHILHQVAERTFIVFRILASVETLQGRENLLAKLLNTAFTLSQ